MDPGPLGNEMALGETPLLSAAVDAKQTRMAATWPALSMAPRRAADCTRFAAASVRRLNRPRKEIRASLPRLLPEVRIMGRLIEEKAAHGQRAQFPEYA